MVSFYKGDIIKKMNKIKREKYKDLVAESCEVLDLYKNKAIVNVSDKENLIAKRIGRIKKGDKVNLFKMQTINRIDEILIYISPVYYMILGFIFGFLFNHDLYHYLLILGLTLIGFIQFFVLKYLIKKMPLYYYVAINKDIQVVQNDQK